MGADGRPPHGRRSVGVGATCAFYEDLLGLDRSREYGNDGAKNYYLTGAGPGERQFRVVDDAPDPAGIDHVAVADDDVDATLEGAVEEDPRMLERVNRRLAAITDPDGYTAHPIEDR